jgi:solute carrier family 45 protein 1/2/4
VASLGRDANIACADCTPYLLSLGLSKGQTSLVWVAGPLSGLIVQPIIGVVADQSTSKWGRRRPIIVIGSIIVALALLVLGFTKEIVASVGFNPETARILTIMLAVLSLYVVDFAINAGEQRCPPGPYQFCTTNVELLVMSCARSLVVDTLPIHKQQIGAAWGKLSRPRSRASTN